MRDANPGRSPRAAYPEAPVHAPHAALLIDFDNVTMGIRSDLQNQLRKLLSSDIFKGKVSVQRAYADWRRYPQYIVPLSEASIDLIFAPAFGSNKKNATDIRLAIDALELVFTRPEIGTYILLSGDSDFSSLVLKLKEYGKYVIGVGIRESSSDLLIQNCDEYYSYNELTGLSKEGEVEIARRDPWELVVDAVLRMKEENDVMRSDRLKQVMQSIDPNFDEKEVGFNRFSKFVQECGRRGLLTLSKLDNGQYAIDVGADANVPPGEETALRQAEATRAERAARSRRRRPERERRGAPGPGPLALAEAFELLKQALWVLGAVGAESAEGDRVRSIMVDLYGDESDPVFDRNRFRRFLRQAHDAGLIDLVKDDQDRYLLKLSPTVATADATATPEPEKPPPAGEPVATVEAVSQPHRARSGARRGGRGRGRSRAGGESGQGDAAQGSARGAERREAAPMAGAEQELDAAERPTGGAHGGKRNPRFRRGSRGPRGAAPDAAAEPREPAPMPIPQLAGRSAGARSLGPRTGSRTLRPVERVQPAEAPGPSPRAEAEASPPPPPGAAVVPQPERAPPGSAEEVLDRRGPEAPEESEGLFRRMTAALHRMVGGTPPKREQS